MSRDFLIRLGPVISRLPANEAENFLFLLQRNDVFSPAEVSQFLKNGELNFQNVLDRFDRDHNHHISFKEFALSSLGRNFHDLPHFIQWTQRLGLEDIFQGFTQLSGGIIEQAEWQQNPTWLIFRAFEDLSILRLAPEESDPDFWRYLFLQVGSAVYFHAPEALRFQPDIVRPALRSATQPDDFRRIVAGLPQSTLEALQNDPTFFIQSVRTNPQIASLLPSQRLNHEFLLSLCRINFNVLSYLPAEYVRLLWEELSQEARGNLYSASTPHPSGTYPEFLQKLRAYGMTQTGRLHNLRAAFHLIEEQNRSNDTRPIIYILYPHPSGDRNNAFLAAPDLDNVLLNSSPHYRFIYFEAKTADEVFERLHAFSRASGRLRSQRNANLLFMTHADSEGMILSVNPQTGRTEHLNASHFSSGRNFTPYISGAVYLSGCGTGQHLAQDFARENPGLMFVAPDRYFEGAEIFFDSNGKLNLRARGLETMLFFKE